MRKVVAVTDVADHDRLVAWVPLAYPGSTQPAGVNPQWMAVSDRA